MKPVRLGPGRYVWKAPSLHRFAITQSLDPDTGRPARRVGERGWEVAYLDGPTSRRPVRWGTNSFAEALRGEWLVDYLERPTRDALEDMKFSCVSGILGYRKAFPFGQFVAQYDLHPDVADVVVELGPAHADLRLGDLFDLAKRCLASAA